MSITNDQFHQLPEPERFVALLKLTDAKIRRSWLGRGPMHTADSELLIAGQMAGFEAAWKLHERRPDAHLGLLLRKSWQGASDYWIAESTSYSATQAKAIRTANPNDPRLHNTVESLDQMMEAKGDDGENHGTDNYDEREPWEPLGSDNPRLSVYDRALQALPDHLQDLVWFDLHEDYSEATKALKLGVSERTIGRWRAEYRRTLRASIEELEANPIERVELRKPATVNGYSRPIDC